MTAGMGGVMIAVGLSMTVVWIMLRWLDNHGIYFAPTLTPEARTSGAAEREKSIQQRQVVVFRRYLVPAGLFLAIAGVVTIAVST